MALKKLTRRKKKDRGKGRNEKREKRTGRNGKEALRQKRTLAGL